MLSNITVKNKLRLPLFGIITIFSLSSVLNILFSWKQSELSEQLNRLFVATVTLNDAYRDFYQASYAVSGMVLSTTEQEFERHNHEYKDNAYRAIPRLKASNEVADLMQRGYALDVTELIKTSQLWLDNYESLRKEDKSNWADVFHNNRALAFQLFADVRKDLKVVSNAIDQRILDVEEGIEHARFLAERTLQLSIGLVILLAIALLAFYTKTVIEPIEELKLALQNIASGEGDLSQRVDKQSNDELGEMTDAFNAFVEQIQRTVKQVAQTSTSLSSELNQLYSLTQSISHSTTSQQTDSQLVATAVQEMQHAAHSVSDNTLETARSAQSTQQQIVDASATINQTINEMSALASDVNTAGGVIDALNQDVGRISSVLDVIRGIADQTNLLALNAAIEAARAGEQGRGFAVVADEVRSLASRTQESTGEIHQMIERLESGAQQAVDVMNESVESSKRTILSAGKASECLSRIQEGICAMSDKTSFIATASQEQKTVSDEVAKNIQTIAYASEQIVIIVQQASASFAMMEKQSHELNRQVSRFKL